MCYNEVKIKIGMIMIIPVIIIITNMDYSYHTGKYENKKTQRLQT